MANVYIVEGNTGEYSDYTSWNVAAYLDKAMAERHAESARNFAPGPDEGWPRRDSIKNPYDPSMRTDYTGTQYNVLEVELRTELPETRPEAKHA